MTMPFTEALAVGADCALAQTGGSLPMLPLALAGAALAVGGVALLAFRRRKGRRVVTGVATGVTALIAASFLVGAAQVPTECAPPSQDHVAVAPAPEAPVLPPVSPVRPPVAPIDPGTPPEEPAPDPDPQPEIPDEPTYDVTIDWRERVREYGPTSTTEVTRVTLTNTSPVDSSGPLRLRVSTSSPMSTVTGFFESLGAVHPSITVLDDSDPRNVLIELDEPLDAEQSLTFWVERVQHALYHPGCPGLIDDGRPFRVDVLNAADESIASDAYNPPSLCEI